MKFTSEDLLKAMGLKVTDIFTMPNTSYKYLVCKQVKTNEITIYDFGLDKNIPLLDFIKNYKMLEREDYTIIQPKPTLTEDEKVILKNLPKEYKYVTRDSYGKGGNLVLCKEFPKRNWVINGGGGYWLENRKQFPCSTLRVFNHLFEFIKWEDEPYEIAELLK